MFKAILKKAMPERIINLYHFCLAFFAAFVFRFPSKKIKVIGITGTNGKTTTCLMVCRILEEAGFTVGSVSTLFYKIGKEEKSNPKHMTMPGRFVLQKALRKMVKNKCEFAVLEATSEGIKQYRHKFIRFAVCLLTNLSKEHIEAHGGFEKYRETKAKLFRENKMIHILNKNDENSKHFLDIPAKEKIFFNYSELKDLRIEKDKSGFVFKGQPFVLHLPGIFNVYNGLVAIVCCSVLGVDLVTAAKALEKITNIPGRFELVKNEPFKIIIDVAHTPEAVERVYQQSQKMLSLNGRLIAVFGAAGGLRDHWKRPVLGRVAGRYCQIIILTNEDPYDEAPEKIIKEIKSGIANKAVSVFEVQDRKVAIAKALAFAKIGDVVLLLGKGTEPNMVFENNRKTLWNEKQVVLEILKILNYDNKRDF